MKEFNRRPIYSAEESHKKLFLVPFMEWLKRVTCLLNPQTKERAVEEVSVKIFFGEDIRRTSIPEAIEMKQLEQILRYN